jgi:hypothetical protein
VKKVDLSAGAAYLGVSNTDLIAACKSGLVSFEVVGNRYWFTFEALDAFEAQEQGGFHDLE